LLAEERLRAGWPFIGGQADQRIDRRARNTDGDRGRRREKDAEEGKQRA